MCNLYSLTRSQDAIRAIRKAMRDKTGNLAPGSIFPDRPAPVIRKADGGDEMLMMRWGFPPLKAPGPVITNVRNTTSNFWKGWLRPEFRCLVPVSSFCEYTDATPKIAHWFALDDSRPLFFFAGIWRPWTGVRGTKKEPIEGEHLLYSFLTTEANEVVRPIHAKAMPVMLTSEEDCDRWLNAPVDEALQLQRPYPADRMKVVAFGKGMTSDQPNDLVLT